MLNGTQNISERNCTFGSVMNERTYTAPSTDYKYGFNGMERDDEVSGESNTYGAEFRMFDSRIGRWQSVDLATGWFPQLSPYNGLNNNPLVWIDPEGLWHREKRGKGSNKSEHLVADKGDNLESLDNYLGKRGNKKRYTDIQKSEIRDEVKKYGEAHTTYNTSPRTFETETHTSYDGFDLSLTEKFNAKVKIYVSMNSGEGNTFYEKFGGHVGIQVGGKFYHYYYKNSENYRTTMNEDGDNIRGQIRFAFKTFPGEVRIHDNINDFWRSGGTHHSDVYFTKPISLKQLNSLNRTLSAYEENPSACPNYGFFSKRCTSMANNFLSKSGIRLSTFNFIMKRIYTLHPGAMYNHLKRKGYEETNAR